MVGRRVNGTETPQCKELLYRGRFFASTTLVFTVIAVETIKVIKSDTAVKWNQGKS